jgi:hypothetical protein
VYTLPVEQAVAIEAPGLGAARRGEKEHEQQ